MKVAKTLKPVSLILLLSFPLLVQPASAAPTPALSYSTRFNTCAQMKKQYRFGIALSLKIAGDYPAKISKLLYQRNKGLDFDYDGIVCETERLQNYLNPRLIQTTSTTTSTTTVVPSLPQSPQNLSFRSNGTATLRRGVTYQITLCTNTAEGSTPFLDILSIATGWTQKATGLLAIDAAKCSSAGYPYLVTFGWLVNDSPGQVSSMRLRGFAGGDILMKVVITN